MANPAPEANDWRQKYFDSLGSLENEQRRFQSIEASLKRLAGRLCVASLGHDDVLDQELKRLQNAMRRDVGSDEIDKLTTSLTDAINKLDHKAADSAPPVVPEKSASSVPPAIAEEPATKSAAAAPVANAFKLDEQRIRAVLSTLLSELRRDPELTLLIDDLDDRLGKNMQADTLPDYLAATANLVGQRIKRVEAAKEEIEGLLNQMVGRLDEIGHIVHEQSQTQKESQANNETLNVQLVGEMRAMGESVESESDIKQLRSFVRYRLDAIGQHLQQFRDREASLSATIDQRTRQLQSRVAELEAEAKNLHEQLKDEQRMASVDPLTKVPNRLAYQRRIDEELQRWRRFKQPTCIAVWDVDHFKRINDTHGHATGDKVLVAVAQGLNSRIRSTDFLARFGGEEFVMVLCGTPAEKATALLDTIRSHIAQLKLHVRGTPLPVTISCGFTALNDNDDATAAFERADKALYAAKQAGRNRCVAA